tara:strand:+ start:163 stop:288 length:126 start_codon:yes stop_codon:yes gene_type:complete
VLFHFLCSAYYFFIRRRILKQIAEAAKNIVPLIVEKPTTKA